MNQRTPEVKESGLPKKVKLWNDGQKVFDYEIPKDGERYVIQPGKYIELARRDAIKVRGFYPGKDIQVSLRIEPIPGEVETQVSDFSANGKTYFCAVCDKEFALKTDAITCQRSHDKTVYQGTSNTIKK